MNVKFRIFKWSVFPILTNLDSLLKLYVLAFSCLEKKSQKLLPNAYWWYHSINSPTCNINL